MWNVRRFWFIYKLVQKLSSVEYKLRGVCSSETGNYSKLLLLLELEADVGKERKRKREMERCEGGRK